VLRIIYFSSTREQPSNMLPKRHRADFRKTHERYEVFFTSPKRQIYAFKRECLQSFRSHFTQLIGRKHGPNKRAVSGNDCKAFKKVTQPRELQKDVGCSQSAVSKI